MQVKHNEKHMEMLANEVERLKELLRCRVNETDKLRQQGNEL